MKFIDDASQVAAINLKQSLMQDPVSRQRPLNYHERSMMVLKPEEDIVTQELDRFCEFINQNGFVINKKKCYAMVFSRSRKYDFPPEFSIGDSQLLEKKEATILGLLDYGLSSQIYAGNLKFRKWLERQLKLCGL